MQRDPRGHLAFTDEDNWRFGDLLIAAVPRQRGSTEAQMLLAKLAAELGVTLNMVKDRYYTADAWPRGTRLAGISYARHAKYRARKSLLLDMLADEETDLSTRTMEMVHDAEKLLRDKAVRDAVVSRARGRMTRVAQAAKAIEDEELAREKAEARAEARRLEAEEKLPEHQRTLPVKFIGCNRLLTKTAQELFDLDDLIWQVPPSYVDRTVSNLERVERAVKRLLANFRPDPAKPTPPGTFIDVSSTGTGDQGRGELPAAPD